jgi:hypothetical protein
VEKENVIDEGWATTPLFLGLENVNKSTLNCKQIVNLAAPPGIDAARILIKCKHYEFFNRKI